MVTPSQPAGSFGRTLVRAAAWLVVALLALTALIASACSRGPSGDGSSGDRSRDDFVARADARRYELTGAVVRVDPAARRASIAHEAIPNYMDAMTMEFAVKEAWALKQMGPGDRVRAVLVVDGARSWIEQPAITKASGQTAATAPRGTWVPADPGTPLPDVALIDQDGAPFRLDRYRGQVLLLTFSFTRCPLPDYCPLMMTHFRAIERQTTETPALKSVRLLTVTIDPAYDTPAVLRAYGAKHAIGDGPARPFTRWSLATGQAAEVKKLAAFFGLDYFEEEKRIVHSLRTAVVDPEGRVVKVFEGNEWTVEEVMRALQAVRPAAQTRAVETSGSPAARRPS